MKGWKTILGSIITILGSAYGIYNKHIDIESGLQAIGAALAVIGIGHKLDKNTEVMKGDNCCED